MTRFDRCPKGRKGWHQHLSFDKAGRKEYCLGHAKPGMVGTHGGWTKHPSYVTRQLRLGAGGAAVTMTMTMHAKPGMVPMNNKRESSTTTGNSSLFKNQGGGPFLVSTSSV